ncbi:MAG: S8 family peptidase [Candidatus Levybacteria bacterium]|nr:S8 family peptidase [Candidatus Levybacteria bacterium]
MKKLSVFSITLLFILLLGFFNLFSPSVKAQDNNNHVPGQVLIKFKDGVSQTEKDNLLRNNRTKIVDKIDLIDVLVLRVPEMAEDKVINALSKNPNVEFAELDYIATAFSTDTDFGLQWGLENTRQTVNGVVGIPDADIDAPEAWVLAPGNAPIVAILDTGINENHLDLVGKFVAGSKDYTNSKSGTMDVYGHGTHVAGIVAASTNNNKGVAGVCPQCLLLNVKVLNDSGSGSYSNIAKGIVYAVGSRAKVINMSLGGPTKSSTLESAVNSAWNSGVVVVAAAGNSNNPSKTYPAAYVNVIAVAATDNTDHKASFSSYGAKWVDIAAPGVYIYSTWKNATSANKPYPVCDSMGTECYKYASGTSMATPMVAGIAGLVWATNPSQSQNSVRSHIESTADIIDGIGTYWSSGRVNAANAVAP